MAERKRMSSFRKLFNGNFFSQKNKDKSRGKDINAQLKYTAATSSRSNHYYDPRIIVGSEEGHVLSTTNYNDRIYENLSIATQVNRETETTTHDINSNHSSSSTLVSDSMKIKSINASPKSTKRKEYSARPQVPPKPHNDLGNEQTSSDYIQYPDVYYHSMEKLSDDISPLDESVLYKASRHPSNPESVSAEIKKVSTTFLISPKKEAAVRTIKPIRARSLSFDKNNTTQVNSEKANNPNKMKQGLSKPYNYSAPTTPIPTNHKIPCTPKTISPYEHVKKTMIESEKKRNTLNGNKMISPKKDPVPLENHNDGQRRSTSPINLSRSSLKLADVEKDKARQKVEAFYWQKLREQKQKEDEYLLRHTITSTSSPSGALRFATHSYSDTPHAFSTEPRSYSLPRGICSYDTNQRKSSISPQFVRGTFERRTDTFINRRAQNIEPDVVYRHPEKLMVSDNVVNNNKHAAIFHRGSLTRDVVLTNQQKKRVSFEEQCEIMRGGFVNKGDNYPDRIPMQARISKNPPQPPIRTTSVNTKVNQRYGFMNSARKVIGTNSGQFINSESESGSEAGEIQRILQRKNDTLTQDEDWHGDGSRIDGGLSDGEASRGGPRGRPSRRDDPRRHTLAGNHLYGHPHHPAQINNIDMEPPLPRPYPANNALLFDDDPGIMSEVETSSTGFRRGGKQRSSLPVVRTPSKTLERPLGLVFLQYRNETKRALLPNEITSIDTVKALFVRSFPKQLTMQYMDSPMVKIYIHDSSKDMFYELEDIRAHLRDIRDRSVLRLFEAADMGGGVFPGAVGVGSLAMPPGAASCSGPSSWDQDQNYFSEPEIDSDYHHQHIHKSKGKAPAYYIGTGPAPSTLPRGGSLLRAFSPAAPAPADRANAHPAAGAPAPAKPLRVCAPAGAGAERCLPFADCPHGPDYLYTIPGHAGDGYMSSPERGGARAPYEDPYYAQFLGPAAGRATITPVIDEESSESVLIDESYQMYGVNPLAAAPRPMPRPSYDARLNPQVDDIQRLRVEKMERQLANLTGLVQKALQVPGQPASAATSPRPDFPAYATAPRPPNADAARFASSERPPKLGRDKFQKSVSFEKSVSFSDDPPDMNSPKQHSPQHSADTKPTKPAIKSSTLPRTSSQERDRLKPAPPPKPAGLAGQPLALAPQRAYTINVTPDFFNQLRVLQKQSRDLRLETRNMRRSTLSHAIQMRQLMAETIVKIGALAASFCDHDPQSQLTREEEIYRQDMLLLENDLYELEATVERLRGQAANREARVNMADIERIAMVLSSSSKTVADWKLKFPILQDTMKVKLAAEMEKVVRKEKMLEDEPERLELALRRCKKLTGTLVTLKRLACVQEQRLPAADGRLSPGSSQSSTFTAGPSSEEFASESTCPISTAHNKGSGGPCGGRGAAGRGAADVRAENALDALLDELQTFAKPCERGEAAEGAAAAGGAGSRGDGALRRLHSYPSGSDTDASPPVRARGQHPPKPPVPERHPELLALAARRAPPPPPPRTTSRSPLASPPSPASPPALSDADDQAGSGSRQAILELRHQELLKKQKALQEQYARLQMIQRSGPALPPNAQPDLKKTGSESNLLTKMNLNMSAAAVSGSMTHLPGEGAPAAPSTPTAAPAAPAAAPRTLPDPAVDTYATTNKVYETDIL